MTTVYRHGSTFTVGIPTRNGRWIKKTTGTSDRALAKAMGRMIDDLVNRREWLLLEAMTRSSKKKPLSVGEVFDSVRMNELDLLRDRLTNVDLDPLVALWVTEPLTDLAPDTREHYALYVRSLIVAGTRFPASALTFTSITTWLAERAVGPSTKRKYLAALASFCKYARRKGAIKGNPLMDVEAPPPGPPRRQWLEPPEVKTLLDAMEPPYRMVSLLMHATGMMCRKH